MKLPSITNDLTLMAVLRLVVWILCISFAAGAAYKQRDADLTMLSAADRATADQLAPLVELPRKVQSLEEFRARQEKAQERSDGKFEVVQQSLATISAQQTNTDKKLDRLLDTVERMNRRTP